MKVLADTESLSAVAEAIRAKSGGNEELSFPDGFVDAIEGIEGGYDKGYAEGHEKGYAEGETKGEEQGYDRGYKQGKADGSDFTRYIKSLSRTFYDATFPEGYELDISTSDAVGMTHFMCLATGVKSVKLAFVNKGATINANYAFGGDNNLKGDFLETVDISNVECKFDGVAGMFQMRKVLKHVIGEIDLSVSTTNNAAFYNCLALEDVSFKPLSIGMTISFSNSPLLSAASVQSIINGLADLTGANTQTLSFHADVKATLTEEQLVSITQKNWTVA